MRERYNKNFVETNYGIDASSVTFIKHLGKEIEASNGSPNEYIALLEFAAANDLSANDEAYAYMASQMDMGNFARYMLAEMYTHNGDWPNNNVRIWRAPESPLWKFMVYDLDHGFDWEWGVTGFGSSTNMFKWAKQGGRTDGSCYTSSDNEFVGGKEHCFHVLYARLIKNPKFKSLFLNNAAVMIDSYLNAKNIRAKAQFLAGMLNADDVARDMAVEAYKERRSQYNHSFDPYGERLGTWADDRDPEFLTEIKSEFGVSDLVSVNISANGNGTILMDGANLPNGSYKGKLFAGNTVELTAVPNAGAVFAGWSDGATTDVTRIVPVTEGLTLQANFK
jgi:hypothetical protein